MSSLTLPCHKWFDYISTDFPLAVVFREVQVYETPFTTHQTFAKHVTQIFLCAIKLQKHNFLVTITSTSFENLSNDFKRSRLTSHQVNIHIST